MLCQNCGKNPAQVHSIININGTVTDRHLCLACAQQVAGATLSIGDFIAGVMGDAKRRAQPETAPARCSVCGISQDEMLKAGRVGCAKCYTAFSDVLAPMLERIHGHAQHSGKTPSHVDACALGARREAEELRRQLDQAISSEEYERAAELRDRIRALSSGGKEA